MGSEHDEIANVGDQAVLITIATEVPVEPFGCENSVDRLRVNPFRAVVSAPSSRSVAKIVS